MKILFATDGSENSKKAMEITKDLADEIVDIIHVVPMIDESIKISAPVTGIKEVFEAEGLRILGEAEKYFKKHKIESSKILEVGDPADKIVEYSKKHDLVVLGVRGRTPIQKFLIGSIADKVVKHSTCSVLVVR